MYIVYGRLSKSQLQRHLQTIDILKTKDILKAWEANLGAFIDANMLTNMQYVHILKMVCITFLGLSCKFARRHLQIVLARIPQILQRTRKF